MTRAAAFFVLPLALALGFAGTFACSTNTTVVNEPAPDAGASSSSGENEAGPVEPEPFALTSSAFEDGQPLPIKYSCGGDNVSPPLSWTAGPEGTKSYTIVFVDTDNNLTHSAIYDIPADTTSLPENVSNEYEPADVPGAKQPKSYKPTVFGYAGPCPNAKHTYVWTIYAIDVEALPDTSETTTKEQVATLAKAHDLASTKLSATYEP